MSTRSPDFPYAVEPVYAQNARNEKPIDLQLVWPHRTWQLLGRGGAQREHALLRPLESKPTHLPVLLGSGLGHALDFFLASHDGPIAVVDCEEPILAVSRAKKRFAQNKRVLWISSPSPQEALHELTRWQMEHGGAPLLPLSNPVYLRLRQELYARLRQELEASQTFDFWAKTRYPRFTSWPPRVLLITSQYFLMGEIVTACERLNVPHYFINIDDDEIARQDFVESLLKAVIEFQPDLVFTINHLGVDREGVLIELLQKLKLPLASWFVDNPHLILYLYNRLVSDYTSIFTWDADNIKTLQTLGFQHVHYLPLGTDVQRFKHVPHPPTTHPLRAPISFVGNSMNYKVGHRLKVARPPRELLLKYKEIARSFSESNEPSVRVFLQQAYAELLPLFEDLDTVERRLAFEAMITWEATRQYRRQCLEQILPFEPLIAGDKGWLTTFKHAPHPWHWHTNINYYQELPNFYPLSDINFNCTSKQMKGAVNQRIFDVPATGAFVLTDWRMQIERLFEPGKEVICFQDPGEIPELASFYLKNSSARAAITTRARKRILAEHTYEHRLTSMLETMRRLYG